MKPQSPQKHTPLLRCFYPLILAFFWVNSLEAQEPMPAPTPPTEDEQFIDRLWGKEFGQCFMTDSQYEEFEKKWTRYRILLRARYNILAKSYFADKTPKLQPIEIDKAFQYQILEPMTCPGMTDEERVMGVKTALENSLQKDSYTFADLPKLFDLEEAPQKLEDYLDLFNDPTFISMPYSLQDGYDQLFKLPWDRKNSSRKIQYDYTETNEVKTTEFLPEDQRAIDGIARTFWGEVSGCNQPENGHYQLIGRMMVDRLNACEKDPLVNRRHCRADPFGQKLPKFERIIASPAQFPSWVAGSYEILEVTNTAGRKIGSLHKQNTGFRKLINPNSEFRRTLCPTMDPSKIPLLKKAYVVALEFYRDPDAFAKKWQWPKTVKNGIRFYSYGRGSERGHPKNVHSILNTSITPPEEIDFRKQSSTTCPTPYLYERR